MLYSLIVFVTYSCTDCDHLNTNKITKLFNRMDPHYINSFANYMMSNLALPRCTSKARFFLLQIFWHKDLYGLKRLLNPSNLSLTTQKYQEKPVSVLRGETSWKSTLPRSCTAFESLTGERASNTSHLHIVICIYLKPIVYSLPCTAIDC